MITILTPSPGNGDIFKAPVPDETYPLPVSSWDIGVFFERAWSPFLVGVIAGALIAALAAVIIVRVQRNRNRLREDYSRAPQPEADG
ncbi:hypothetical protein [Nonomuraea sp. NPDC049141]|uniref:hypothetical protein n=1 Tax=Nonomuraea sp. NPDC049141 TaxID=3155500 RepID=UPI0033FE2E04